jgi:hypothetical protein
MAAMSVMFAWISLLVCGCQLALLVPRMLEHMQSWFLMVHKHLDVELIKHTQMKINSKEALILLYEEVIIRLKGSMQFIANRWILW